jgi:hypothetical protein
MIEVLLLGRAHDPTRVRQAVEEALQLGCSDVGAVRYLLVGASRERQPRVGPVELGALNRYDRPQPNLADYERLRPHWPVTEVVQ